MYKCTNLQCVVPNSLGFRYFNIDSVVYCHPRCLIINRRHGNRYDPRNLMHAVTDSHLEDVVSRLGIIVLVDNVAPWRNISQRKGRYFYAFALERHRTSKVWKAPPRSKIRRVQKPAVEMRPQKKQNRPELSVYGDFHRSTRKKRKKRKPRSMKLHAVKTCRFWMCMFCCFISFSCPFSLHRIINWSLVSSKHILVSPQTSTVRTAVFVPVFLLFKCYWLVWVQ